MKQTRRAFGALLIAIAVGGSKCGKSTEYAAPPVNSYTIAEFDFASGASGEKLRGATVSPEFFASNVRPLVGRFFLPIDYDSTARSVIVISHDLWARRFNSEPSTIGTSVRLSGRAVTVVGIAPPRYAFPGGASLLVPGSPK